MDNKFFIYNVAKILSEKTGKKASEIETFLKELGFLFSEGITNNNFVKIKGIGAFKVVRVKERESINVNTGERFMIPPHYKLSFIPEKKMKDMINKPFALFETIEAQEDEAGLMSLGDLNIGEDDTSITNYELRITGEAGETEEIGETGSSITNYESRITGEADDIESLIDLNVINDLNNMKEIEEKPLSPPPIPPIEAKPLTQPVIPPIDEKPQAPQPSLPIEEKPMRVSPPPPSTLPPPPLSNQTSKHRKKKKSKRSSTTFLFIILFFLLFVLVVGVVYYFFFYDRMTFLDNMLNSSISAKQEIALPGETIQSDNILNVASTPVDTLALAQSETGKTDTTKAEIVVPAAEPVSGPAAAMPTPRQEPAIRTTTNPTPPATASSQTTTAAASNNNNNNVLARVRIESGQRLTLIAERYYGNKVFWVHIYEYNKAKIGRNPNILRTGMEILVPAKELYGIDANSAASINKATDIQREILEGL